jgi:hypothetical protein
MLSKFKDNGDSSAIVPQSPCKINPAAPTHYDGAKGFDYLEGFPNCGNAKVHHYVLLALKHLLRLGRKDELRIDLNKAIVYLARAIYVIDPANFNVDEIARTFKGWS